jgi:hypothetical protein
VECGDWEILTNQQPRFPRPLKPTGTQRRT